VAWQACKEGRDRIGPRLALGGIYIWSALVLLACAISSRLAAGLTTSCSQPQVSPMPVRCGHSQIDRARPSPGLILKPVPYELDDFASNTGCRRRRCNGRPQTGEPADKCPGFGRTATSFTMAEVSR
jgi:hypothetical protein